MLLALDRPILGIDSISGQRQGISLRQVKLPPEQVSACSDLENGRRLTPKKESFSVKSKDMSVTFRRSRRKKGLPSRASKLQSLQTSLPCSQKMASFTSREEVELVEADEKSVKR